MITYNDNRNFFRMMVNTDMEVEIADADAGRKIAAICRDLSATGMAIETDEPIEIGTQVLCKVGGTTPGLPGLNAMATVKRCVEQESGIYILGVEIQDHL